MSSSSDSEGFVYDPSHEDDSGRGPSKTSKTPTNNDEETALLNYEHEYDTFTNDVIGTSENNERNTTTFKREKKKKPRKKGRRRWGK